MLNYEEFCAECRKLGIKELIREVTEYDSVANLPQLYAIKNNQLVGCYSNPTRGGVIYNAPIKKWSSAKRKFIKEPI